MKKIIHIEHDGEELGLKFENVDLPEVGILVSDMLLAICNNRQFVTGDNTSKEAKDVLMHIILDKFGYCLGEE